jgi:hypothetical protein
MRILSIKKNLIIILNYLTLVLFFHVILHNMLLFEVAEIISFIIVFSSPDSEVAEALVMRKGLEFAKDMSFLNLIAE